MKRILKITRNNIARCITISVLFLFATIPLYFSAMAAQVETPESFMARKKSSYKKALEELKKEYRKWCVVAGKPIIPVGQGGGAEQQQPPGGAGGFETVQTPGSGGYQYYVENVEIEQVMNTWYSTNTWSGGSNPFSWVDVSGTFRSTGGSSSGGDKCTGRSMNFDTSAPGGPYAGIDLNETTRSCGLAGFSFTSSSSVYFNALANKYQFGAGTGWTGTTNFNAMYGSSITGEYSKSGRKAIVKFRVTNNTPADPSKAVLSVDSVTWQ